MLLETHRLVIRPFTRDDLDAIHRILTLTFGDRSQIDDPHALDERSRWLEWSILSQEWLPKMDQPPYGDLAVEQKSSGKLIGSTGFSPLLGPHEQLPELGGAPPGGAYTAEVGLFWAIDPDYQRQGYATEAGRAMINYAFEQLHLKRILAGTEYENIASQRVMQRLGMKLSSNPYPDPPWLQVVGILINPLFEAT